jgi:coproporphyrinogen III oxidase-like Fe-S oxidoreductase
VIAELQALELVERRESRVRLTQRGRLMSNEVFERFLGDQAVAQADLVMVD